ncbi:MAG: M14 metallopeptidase family protein, partial [Bryobacteraceae bacterium]
MVRRASGSLLLFALCLSGAHIPTPKEHLGFLPGDDFKLAGYAEISGYFRKLAAASDRIRLIDAGRTSEGQPMFLAAISDPENLSRLEHFRGINRRLALGLASPEEAERLSNGGKVFVWIDSGLHASEVAPAQHSPELAYRMLTDESAEMTRIRRNVILLQIPVINPDGLDHIVQWYRKNLGKPTELAPLPWLYQKYAGHDNNRDWYMMNLQETRNISKLLFADWFPEIVYNQHQAPAFPARIFVPPYAEPLNPNIPASVMEGINLIGAAMKERFARENKPGILSYYGYDAWWNGGLRSVPAFHNMHGILTETALYAYATPREYKLAELPERFPNGMPTKEPSVFYQRPWLGGKWGVRNAIDYMLTADLAILELASTRSSSFLHKAWEMAVANIEAGRSGKPYAYVVGMNQPDKSSAVEMLRRFRMGGLQIQRALSAFTVNGKEYSKGAYVIPAGQPFRGYLMDLLEPQRYPEMRSGTNGPVKRPYDISGWTLNLQMGVSVERVEAPFAADLEEVTELKDQDPSLDHRDNSSFLATADLLSRNAKVRWAKNGDILTEGAANFSQGAWELRTPRLAVYESWTANIDTGWTQWVLDTYKVPHTVVHNRDLQNGGLASRFDTIIISSESTNSILHGNRDGERPGTGLERSGETALQRREYTGGIGVAGLA